MTRSWRTTGIDIRFRDYPMRRKLLLIVLVTTIVAIAVTTVIFFIADAVSFRSHEAEHRRALAKIIGVNMAAAVESDDRLPATESIRSLESDPHILSAWVVLGSGEVFASHVRNRQEKGIVIREAGGKSYVAAEALKDQAVARDGLLSYVRVVAPVVSNGKTQFSVIIVSDLRELKERMSGYLFLALLVAAAAALVGAAVSLRLQRIITDPLHELVETMEGVRISRDFTLRAREWGRDEIGILTNCFNQMIREVQVHEEQLVDYQNRLSELISIRTEELIRVKEKAEERGAARISPANAVEGLNLTAQEEELLLYALMECVDEEVWFFDPGGGYALVNRVVAKSAGFGLSGSIVKGAMAAGFEIYRIELSQLQRPDLPPFSELQGINVRRMEVMLLKGDDSVSYQLINSMPVRGGSGGVSGTVFVVRDITLLKDAEETRLLASRRLIESEESLRKSLAAELHDEIGRDITALHLFLQVINNGLPVDAREAVSDTIQLVQGLLDELSCKVANIISELRPPMLNDFGLGTALKCLSQTVSQRHGIQVNLFADESFPRLGSDVETALYRIAQEALNNAVKHSSGDLVTISLEQTKESVMLEVSDNGSGFDPAGGGGRSRRPSWGVTIMRERAESVGGSLAIDSTPGEGTKITVDLRRSK